VRLFHFPNKDNPASICPHGKELVPNITPSRSVRCHLPAVQSGGIPDFGKKQSMCTNTAHMRYTFRSVAKFILAESGVCPRKVYEETYG
jgi:hypothetical protein